MKNIVLTALSHLLWEDKNKDQLWAVMTQNNAWAIRVQSVCLPQHHLPVMVRLHVLGPEFALLPRGDVGWGKWTYIMGGWNPWQPKLSIKNMTKKSGIIRILRKKAQMVCPGESFLFNLLSLDQASWSGDSCFYLVLLCFCSLFLYSFSSLFFPSLSGASIRWMLNNPLCLQRIKSRTLLLLNLISHVIVRMCFFKGNLVCMEWT